MMISLFFPARSLRLAVALLFHRRNYYEFIEESLLSADNLLNFVSEQKGERDEERFWFCGQRA